MKPTDKKGEQRMPTVFITGTSSGIGRGTAKCFLEHGWNVASTQLAGDIVQETELTQYPNFRLYELDVLDYERIPQVAQQVIAEFGSVDVVINNAGIGIMGPIELGKRDQILKIFQINVVGYVLVTQAFLPYMRQARKGTVVNVGAMGARLVHPGLGYYNMTKAAIAALSEELLMELAPFGIDVKLVEPSGVKSNLSATGTDFLDPAAIEDYRYFYSEQLPRTGLVLDGTVVGTEEFYPPIEAEEMGAIIYDAVVSEEKVFRHQSGPHARRLLEERGKMTDQEYIDAYKKFFKADGRA